MSDEKQESMNIKEVAASNHMTLGKMMDLMNKEYDHSDPKYDREVKIGVPVEQPSHEKKSLSVKEIAASNHMTLGKMMDLMNRDYDQNDPRFLREVSLHIYDYAKKRARLEVADKIKTNMVTKPETIGLPKDNNYLQGMEQAIDAIDQSYSMDAEQKAESRTR